MKRDLRPGALLERPLRRVVPFNVAEAGGLKPGQTVAIDWANYVAGRIPSIVKADGDAAASRGFGVVDTQTHSSTVAKGTTAYVVVFGEAKALLEAAANVTIGDHLVAGATGGYAIQDTTPDGNQFAVARETLAAGGNNVLCDVFVTNPLGFPLEV